MKYGWENGARVPVRDDFDDEDERPSTDPAALVMARRLVGFMLADNNPALGIECMALVTGIGYTGSSMTEIANKHFTTRAAVSQRCVELCDAFGINPTRAMRMEKSREKCRAARVRSLVSA